MRVALCRSMSCKARSASKRGISTVVHPQALHKFMISTPYT